MLRWDVGCSAAHDHRPMNEDDLTEKNVVVLNRGRHFIGHLRLELPADLTGGTSRLSLWDAEARGTLTSKGGTAEWTTLVHATDPVMRFDLTTKGKLKSYLRPNTFYAEIGLPVMETPLHGATAMQEMLLQSWGGRQRVFPAVPIDWPDVQFHQLRGEGAYLVSARRERGKTQWVLIQSEAGGHVEVDPKMTDAQWIASKGIKVGKDGKGVYGIETSPGDWVMFWPRGEARPKPMVSPVAPHGNDHHFGL